MNQESLSDLEKERSTAVHRFWLFAILIFLFFYGTYIARFGWIMPKDPAIWGAFGDYLGGILNPIIGLANLVVLVYLTFTVSVIDQKRQDRDIKTQKEIAVVSLKYAVEKDFNDFFNQVQKYFMARKVGDDTAFMFYHLEFRSTARSNASLFPFLSNTENWEPLVDAIETLGRSRAKLTKGKDKEEDERSFKIYLDDFSNFLTLREDFQGRIRDVLAEG